MPKIDVKKLSSEDRIKYLDFLWTSISELKSREEIKNFFKDLLSESEAIMLARRMVIARHLLEGKSYDEIAELIRAGKSTIANVHNWLVSGFKGYENVIQKFENALYKRKHKNLDNHAPRYSLDGLRKRYPLHFLLLNILKK